MRSLLAAASLVATTFVAAPAAAQTYFDPGASRAENQVNSANRSMMQQQQNRAVQQQNQFETNALRNEISKPAPPPLVPNTGALGVRR